MSDPTRVAEISKNTGIPIELAVIIEQYDGMTVLQRLIRFLCSKYTNELVYVWDNTYDENWSKLAFHYQPCAMFPFCKPGIECPVCKIWVGYNEQNLSDMVRFGELHPEELIHWLSRGGISWTVPNMHPALSDHIERGMTTAYEHISRYQ